jgi:uncharacterized protein (DUF58 family)
VDHIGPLLAAGQVLAQQFIRETSRDFVVAVDVSRSMLYRYPVFDPDWAPRSQQTSSGIVDALRQTKAHGLKLAASLLLAGAASGFRALLVPFGDRALDPVPVPIARDAPSIVIDVIDEELAVTARAPRAMATRTDLAGVLADLLHRRRSVVVLLSDLWHGIETQGPRATTDLLLDVADRHRLLVGLLDDAFEWGRLPAPDALWMGQSDQHCRDLERMEGPAWQEITRREVREFNEARAEMRRGLEAFVASRDIATVFLDVHRPESIRDSLVELARSAPLGSSSKEA